MGIRDEIKRKRKNDGNRKRGDEGMEVGKYKAKARKGLVEEGYRIWGIVGDQWSSFEGTPSAKRTFKLPNPLYYTS